MRERRGEFNASWSPGRQTRDLVCVSAETLSARHEYRSRSVNDRPRQCVRSRGTGTRLRQTRWVGGRRGSRDDHDMPRPSAREIPLTRPRNNRTPPPPGAAPFTVTKSDFSMLHEVPPQEAPYKTQQRPGGRDRRLGETTDTPLQNEPVVSPEEVR